jgi:phospholipase C
VTLVQFRSWFDLAQSPVLPVWPRGWKPGDMPLHVPPIYHQASFLRHLDAHDVSWRWYSFEPGTLGMADVRYRLGHHDQFAYFRKTGMPGRLCWMSPSAPRGELPLEDAARTTLPSVSWIDPAFTNFNPLGFPVDDDHPPADIKDGQDLILAVYDALATSPQWERSLLVIIYDEHGGFFDHVAPPHAIDDDLETFGRYGVRVPAIIVSPWVQPRSVSHTVRSHVDHQNDPVARLPRSPRQSAATKWGARTAQYRPAAIPGRARSPCQPSRSAPVSHEAPNRPLRDALIQDATARPATHSRIGDPETERLAQATPHLTDLQKRMLAASNELTRLGHPAAPPRQGVRVSV